MRWNPRTREIKAVISGLGKLTQSARSPPALRRRNLQALRLRSRGAVDGVQYRARLIDDERRVQYDIDYTPNSSAKLMGRILGCARSIR